MNGGAAESLTGNGFARPAGAGFGPQVPAAYDGDGSMAMHVGLLVTPGARKEGREPAPLLTAINEHLHL